jgi:hypothetical protein
MGKMSPLRHRPETTAFGRVLPRGCRREAARLKTEASMRIQLLMGTSALLFINWMPPEPAISRQPTLRTR